MDNVDTRRGHWRTPTHFATYRDSTTWGHDRDGRRRARPTCCCFDAVVAPRCRTYPGGSPGLRRGDGGRRGRPQVVESRYRSEMWGSSECPRCPRRHLECLRGHLECPRGHLSVYVDTWCPRGHLECRRRHSTWTLGVSTWTLGVSTWTLLWTLGVHVTLLAKEGLVEIRCNPLPR